ncbi:MAG: hypothetical protein J1F38_00740 [Muribaculaceae bacterium]|nr:hypothetical protein [Muribaculaceae bacterium]
MKTILIVIAGAADTVDPRTGKETPLMVSHIPSLDLLSQRGVFTSLPPMNESVSLNHINALLSLLGYDLQKGEPDVATLMELGLDNSMSFSGLTSVRPFVIPGFSAHGVCVTPSAWVRGASKLALLKPLDIFTPGSSDAEILGAMAGLTTENIMKEEFVFVYVDSPLKATLKGDYDGKVKALELIDRHLVGPVADFIWKSELMINMAVTTDLVTTWHHRRPLPMELPLALYFNNHDWEGDSDNSFTEINCRLMSGFLKEPSDLMRYLINFNVSEEELPGNM